MKGLSALEARFVEEYLVDLNGSAAAKRAGYSARGSAGRAVALRSRPHVAAAIQKRMDERSEITRITADKVLMELAKIGFADLRKLFDDAGEVIPISELDSDLAAAVASLEVTVKPGKADGPAERTYKLRTWDKRMALVDIGKHLGMFRERVDPGPEPVARSLDDAGAARIAAILEAARARKLANER